MTFQQLSYFAEIARTQNYTAAAQNLYVSQSALSHAIRNLEEELGVPLFLRVYGKKVTLTHYGQALLPQAHHILDEVAKATREMDQMRNPLSGVVTLSYSFLNGYNFVPRLFTRFYKENADKDISVHFEVNHRGSFIEDELLLGKLDLAITATKTTDGLEACPIYYQKLFVQLPAGHPLADRGSLTLQEIRDEPLIEYNAGRNLSSWIMEMFQRQGLKPNITLSLEDWSTQLAHVLLGQGIAITPKLPIQSDLLATLPLEDPMNTRPIYLLWPQKRKLSPAAEYVKSFCLEHREKA